LVIQSKGGKIWMRLFPQKPISKKPADTRMSKGKRRVEYWVSAIDTGSIIFEVAGIGDVRP
jgi:large subunit ribosomal protein L16